MCTVSVFLNQGTLLLTANRDELRSRGECGVKQNHQHDLQTIYPVDAKANGTWIGVNNYGVVAALLNMYEASYQGSQSRGLIIPKILQFQSLQEAQHYLRKIFEPEQYATFVLLLMDRNTVVRYAWDGHVMQMQPINLLQNDTPWLLETSSSVESQKTLLHRQQLFNKWVENHEDKDKILNFHLTRDEHNASASICMSREISHTKSITQIELNQTGGELRYLAPERLEPMVNTSPNFEAFHKIKFNLLATNLVNEQSKPMCTI